MVKNSNNINFEILFSIFIEILTGLFSFFVFTGNLK